MSLFQVREWWSTKNGSIEEFVHGSLAVGNVDNENNNSLSSVKIVTGSLQGVLRIFSPRHNEFKIEHLLTEEQLEHPILQIEIGKFIANSNQNAIAILHPRHVSVYYVEPIGGIGINASYYKLKKKYEHMLGIDGEHFTAFNMVTGPFGNIRDKDHICVQSLDGSLQFFEQDSSAFIQQFNSCLIPGPICYAPPIDSFITATSDMQIECYKYQILATSDKGKKQSEIDGSNKETTNSNGNVSKKKLQVDWSINIGETILDITIGKFSKNLATSRFDILVLGEFTLFCLKAQGSIRLQKRLGYHPSTCCLYTRPNDEYNSQNLIIGSHTKHWMIYQDTQLIWSACCSSVPIDLFVTQINDKAGMIVALDQDGNLSVNYLGTDPPSSIIYGNGEGKELNYEEMEEENRQLLAMIRQSQSEKRVEARERIILRAQIPTTLEFTSSLDEYHHDYGIQTVAANYAKNNSGQFYQLTIRIYVTFTGKSSINNVTLSINTPRNITPSEKSIVLNSVDGNSSTPLIIPIILRPSATETPSSLEMAICAAYNLETGQPRTTIYTGKLPLCIISRLVPPMKQSTFKLRLKTDKETPAPLTELFGDMITQPDATPEWAKLVAGNNFALSFQYFNGLDVTIVTSKDAGNYRIQSNKLEALYILTNELVERLQNYYTNDIDSKAISSSNNKDISTVDIQYDDPLPLADFFASIDTHFTLRKERNRISSSINDRSHQFRIIQKRLLVRYKDRNPAPLNQLEILLHKTYEELISLSNEMEYIENQLNMAGNCLSCCIHLLLLLIKFRFQLNDDNFTFLKSHLSPMVIDLGDQPGWEEMTNLSMTQLLRTVLAKTNRENALINAIQQDLEILQDTKKLKKHITIVCDRLGKGANLVSPGTDSSQEPQNIENKENDNNKANKKSTNQRKNIEAKS